MDTAPLYLKRPVMAAKPRYLGNRTGILIAERRKALGWTLEHIAAEVGVKVPTIHRYEKGTSKPQDEHVTPLANALKIDVGVLAEAIKQDRFLGSSEIGQEIEYVTDPGEVRILSAYRGVSAQTKSFAEKMMAAMEQAEHEESIGGGDVADVKRRAKRLSQG